jgi:hypothetical protein
MVYPRPDNSQCAGAGKWYSCLMKLLTIATTQYGAYKII